MSSLAKQGVWVYLMFLLQVSHDWNHRCSRESVWEMKHHQIKIGISKKRFQIKLSILRISFLGSLGLPIKFFSSWKQYYLDDLRLKRNWTKGRCLAKDLVGHTRKSAK